jgi:hypothetical protein
MLSLRIDAQARRSDRGESDGTKHKKFVSGSVVNEGMGCSRQNRKEEKADAEKVKAAVCPRVPLAGPLAVNNLAVDPLTSEPFA